MLIIEEGKSTIIKNIYKCNASSTHSTILQTAMLKLKQWKSQECNRNSWKSYAQIQCLKTSFVHIHSQQQHMDEASTVSQSEC